MMFIVTIVIIIVIMIMIIIILILIIIINMAMSGKRQSNTSAVSLVSTGLHTRPH